MMTYPTRSLKHTKETPKHLNKHFRPTEKQKNQQSGRETHRNKTEQHINKH